MEEPSLDWSEFLRLLGPLEEKGPRSQSVAQAEALHIMASFRQRSAGREAGQTYATRRSRLNRIRAAADELVDALLEAGPECQEEMKVVGDCYFTPEKWTEHEVSLSALAGLGRIGREKDLDAVASVPDLTLRLASLMFVIEEALANPQMVSQPGKWKKPSTVGEATPTMHLVNDCWDLLVQFYLKPTGGLTGVLNGVACELGGMANQEDWNLDRLKREVGHVVRLRKEFAVLEKAFDAAWDEAGSSLLRGPHAIDLTVQDLADRMNQMIGGSKGLLQPTHRLIAWKGRLRWNRALARIAQNPT